MERNPPPTRALLTIERLQGWSMLAYYPLEHLYYLRSRDLIPVTIPSVSSLLRRTSKRVHLNAKFLVLWSCRAWAVYVILQFAHLLEDRKLLLLKEKNLRKGKGAGAEDKEDLRSKWDSFWNEVVANSANLPLALHWWVPISKILPFLKLLIGPSSGASSPVRCVSAWEVVRANTCVSIRCGSLFLDS